MLPLERRSPPRPLSGFSHRHAGSETGALCARPLPKRRPGSSVCRVNSPGQQPSNANRISVIVTVWKRTEYLEQALRSALSQTRLPDEVIVTDDSNSPAIREICERPGSPLIRYRTNPKQLGTAANVKGALAEATGEWVGILNDDDAWEPELLERLSAPLRQDRNRVLAFADHSVMDQSGGILDHESAESSARFGRDTLQAGEIADLAPLIFEKLSVAIAVAALWRRDVMRPDTMLLESGPMYDFWIATVLAASARPAVYVPQRLARYRQHPTMETNRFSPNRAEPAWHIYGELVRQGHFPSFEALFLQRQKAAAVRCGVDHLAADKVHEGREWLGRAAAMGGGARVFLLRLLAGLPAPLSRRVIHSLRQWKA